MALEFQPEMDLNINQIEAIKGDNKGEYTFVHKFTYTINDEQKEVETSLTYKNCQDVDIETLKESLLPTIKKTLEISISYGLGDKATQFDMTLAGEKKQLTRLDNKENVIKFGKNKAKEVVEFEDMADLLKERKGKVKTRSKENVRDEKRIIYQKRLALMNKIEGIAEDSFLKGKKPDTPKKKTFKDKKPQAKKPNKPIKPETENSDWGLFNWFRSSKSKPLPERIPDLVQGHVKIQSKPQITKANVKVTPQSQGKATYTFTDFPEKLTPPNLEKYYRSKSLKEAIIPLYNNITDEHWNNKNTWLQLSKEAENNAINFAVQNDDSSSNKQIRIMYLVLLWAIKLDQSNEKVLQSLVRVCGYLGDNEGALFWSDIRHPEDRNSAEEFFLTHRYPHIQGLVSNELLNDEEKLKRVTAPFLQNQQFILVTLKDKNEMRLISKGVLFSNNIAQNGEKDKIAIYSFSEHNEKGEKTIAKNLSTETVETLHHSLDKLKKK